jgi:hypothetical protein
MAGIVLEAGSGLPVAGIAIRLGKATVYSVSDGTFMALVKRPGAVALAVDLDGSYTPGSWQIVSAPSECSTLAVCRVTVKRAP